MRRFSAMTCLVFVASDLVGCAIGSRARQGRREEDEAGRVQVAATAAVGPSGAFNSRNRGGVGHGQKPNLGGKQQIADKQNQSVKDKQC